MAAGSYGAGAWPITVGTAVAESLRLLHQSLMTPKEKGEAKRFNEMHKAFSAFLSNASLAAGAGTFGIVYAGGSNSYLVLAGTMGAVGLLTVSIVMLTNLKDEE